MKKLLLLAALTVAGGLQAVGVCTERVECDGSRVPGQTFKCPDCICPEVKCPVPAETICECAPAQPIKKEICQEKKSCKPCGHCHACKAGHHHKCHTCAVTSTRATEAAPAAQAKSSVEPKSMKTPKRVYPTKKAN